MACDAMLLPKFEMENLDSSHAAAPQVSLPLNLDEIPTRKVRSGGGGLCIFCINDCIRDNVQIILCGSMREVCVGG